MLFQLATVVGIFSSSDYVTFYIMEFVLLSLTKRELIDLELDENKRATL